MKLTVAAIAVMLAFADAALARDLIRVVGSSTVYPFAATVAEEFARSTGSKRPVIERTGTGGGMRIFCAGLGVGTADVLNASRRMRKAEFEACAGNGVAEIVEVNIGFDGLTIAQSQNGPSTKLTLAHVFLALAQQVPDRNGKLVHNPHRNWSDVDNALPNIKIEVLGPPPTSGTRDSFHELFMEAGAKKLAVLQNLQKADPAAFERLCKSMRADGAYVEVGENDNVIVQKLEANRNAYGIFGYSFLEENGARLKAVTLDGVEPSLETISSGSYPGARRVYIYIKKAHIGLVPGLDKFLDEYVSDRALGQYGYLARQGLVTLPAAQLGAAKKAVEERAIMKGDDLSS
jgi:phosphate transport system substrate-binding protein